MHTHDAGASSPSLIIFSEQHGVHGPQSMSNSLPDLLQEVHCHPRADTMQNSEDFVRPDSRRKPCSPHRHFLEVPLTCRIASACADHRRMIIIGYGLRICLSDRMVGSSIPQKRMTQMTPSLQWKVSAMLAFPACSSPCVTGTCKASDPSF